MSNLQDFSDTELQAELNSRKEIQRRADKPCMIQNPDYQALRTICQKYIDDLHENKWVDDDYVQYIHETAMMVLFGNDVWDWINKHSR